MLIRYYLDRFIICRWDINALLQSIPKLGAVIDLTNTSRYYDPRVSNFVAHLLKQGMLRRYVLYGGKQNTIYFRIESLGGSVGMLKQLSRNSIKILRTCYYNEKLQPQM